MSGKATETPKLSLEAQAKIDNLLLDAFTKNDIGKAKECLENGANVNIADDKGLTPLHYTAANGLNDMVKSLIVKGATLDNQDNSGWTPLHYAFIGEHFDTANSLIDAGANINIVTNLGHTPIHTLIIGDVDPDAVIRESEPGHPEPSAVRPGLNDMVKALIAKGAVLDSQTKDGETPLLKALNNGYQDVASSLIEGGANVNIADSRGWSPLHYAAYHGANDIVKALVNKGAQLDSKDTDGMTPIQMATHMERTEVAATLIAATTSARGSHSEADKAREALKRHDAHTAPHSPAPNSSKGKSRGIG